MATAEKYLSIVIAIAALIMMLAIALPAPSADPAGRATLPNVSVDCQSPSCISPRQLIKARDAMRMKRQRGDRLLLIDIRGHAEGAFPMLMPSDARIAFMEPAPTLASTASTQVPEMEFRLNFAHEVDDALRAAKLGHDDPVVLVSPSLERSVLAALLLQERGYTWVRVVRD